MKPRLRFNYNENYSYELFKDVFQIKNNNSFSREELKAFGNFKNIHYGDIHTKLNKITNVQSTDLPYIAQENEVKLTELCNDYDVLIADASEDYSDIGKCIQLINVKNCVAGLHTVLARPKYKSLYLTHLLSSWYVRKQFMKLACGAKVLGLSKSSLQKVVLPFPKLEEQNKIATFLNLYYKKIELQKKKIEQMEKLSFDALFTHKYDGKTYKLEQVLTEVNERTTQNNQYEVISSTKAGLYYQKDYFNKEIASEDNSGYKILKLNQVVISPQNLWLGNINYNDSIEIGIVSPSYKIFNINEGFNKTFISHLLKSKRAMYDYMISSEQGASVVRRTLNIELFNEIIFMIPDIETQNHIAHQLVLINNKINLEKQNLEAMETYKQGLLQQLFV